MFNERLRALRERAGLSQEKLARLADVSTSTVAKLEQSNTPPNWATVLKLAGALGVGVQEFVDGDQDAPPPKPRRRGRPKRGGKQQ